MEIDRSKPYPVINSLECKSCGRCVVACPKKVLQIGDELNARGYRYVVYSGSGCIGCNNCFYNCPEPNAIEVHVPAKDQ
ncbi:MAG: ferredoxin family protein [Lentisphaeria bacterium]